MESALAEAMATIQEDLVDMEVILFDSNCFQLKFKIGFIQIQGYGGSWGGNHHHGGGGGYGKVSFCLIF